MKQTKIIFFDIDGTLVDMKTKQISERTLQALKKLQENGMYICLATGRSPLALPQWPEITFDAYLTFNGSLCFTKDETIYSNALPQEDVRRIIENASSMGRPVSIATKELLAANGSDADLEEYFAFAHMEVLVAPDFEKLSKQEIYQIMLGCRKEDYDAILAGTSNAKIAAWWDRAVDVIPANAGKGTGIQKILSYFGLEKEEAMAFGDGNNDIEMFQAVKTGVAMGNASLELKAIADDACKPVSEDGIFHYCLQHGLI